MLKCRRLNPLSKRLTRAIWSLAHRVDTVEEAFCRQDCEKNIPNGIHTVKGVRTRDWKSLTDTFDTTSAPAASLSVLTNTSPLRFILYDEPGRLLS